MRVYLSKTNNRERRRVKLSVSRTKKNVLYFKNRWFRCSFWWWRGGETIEIYQNRVVRSQNQPGGIRSQPAERIILFKFSDTTANHFFLSWRYFSNGVSCNNDKSLKNVLVFSLFFFWYIADENLLKNSGANAFKEY